MTTRLHRAALKYAEIGWRVIPLHYPLFKDGECVGCSCEEWIREKRNQPDYVCPSAGKHPRVSNWQSKASTDTAQIDKWWGWWPAANVGIAAGLSALIAVDVDSYKEGGGELNYDTITNETGGGGVHLIFKHPDIKEKLGNNKAGLPSWIDVRGHGGQFVAPPSLHPSGKQYAWASGRNPLDIQPAPLPDEILAPLLDAIRQKKTAVLNRGTYEAQTVQEADVADALAACPAIGDYHDYWLKILMAVHSEFPNETGVQLIEAWSPGGTGEVAEKFKSFNGNGVSIGTLFHIAKENGWRKRAPQLQVATEAA